MTKNNIEEISTESLATELLREIKLSAKRWFFAFIIMVILEIGTIVGFMWYISLPTDGYDIEQESDNESRNYVIGGDYDTTAD